MTSIHAYDPASGAVPPEPPPMTIANLAVGVVDMMSDADHLPQPCLISIHDGSQSVDLLFASVKASVRALTRWALRFGAVLISEPHQGEHGQETWYRVRFDYYGIAVNAFAHIPAEPAAT
jgi:hypothetical protein